MTALQNQELADAVGPGERKAQLLYQGLACAALTAGKRGVRPAYASVAPVACDAKQIYFLRTVILLTDPVAEVTSPQGAGGSGPSGLSLQGASLTSA